MLYNQVVTSHANYQRAKNIFEISKIKFELCHQFEPTGNSFCSAEEQKHTYEALRNAKKAYENSLKVLHQHKQKLAEVSELFAQGQNTLKSIVKKLNNLRRELVVSSDPVFVFSSILPWLIKATVIIVGVVLLLFFIWWVIQRFLPSLYSQAPRIMVSIIVGITVGVTTTVIAYYLFGSPESATVSGVIFAIAVHYFMKEA
jgi:hypothetical protein